MRDDSRVKIFLLCGLGVAVGVYGLYAFWRGADDREWELRWADLDDLDRAWLAAASRSSANRATLEERGELELAKGFGRRELRHRARIVLAFTPLLAGAAVLVITGAVGDRWAPLAWWVFVFIPGAVFYGRDRQIKSRYRETQDRYLVQRLSSQ